MNKSDSIDKWADAMAAAQAELRNPTFDSTNPHFKSKFASLAGVRDTITPVAAKHGLAVNQLLGFEDGRVTCETVVTHKSGQWLSGTFSVAPAKPDAHGVGSAATYCRRYALMAMFNVVGDVDDDGNASTGSQSGHQGADPHRKIRDIADRCIEIHARAVTAHERDGDTSGFWTLYETAKGVQGDERMVLWEMLSKHSAVRAALKEYGDYAKAEAAKEAA